MDGLKSTDAIERVLSSGPHVSLIKLADGRVRYILNMCLPKEWRKHITSYNFKGDSL